MFGWLFVYFDYMGQGVVCVLWELVWIEVVVRGIKCFVIEVDFNVVLFYLILGVEKIGEKELSVILGRFFLILWIMV